jgi:hypothetical protein
MEVVTPLERSPAYLNAPNVIYDSYCAPNRYWLAKWHTPTLEDTGLGANDREIYEVFTEAQIPVLKIPRVGLEILY